MTDSTTKAPNALYQAATASFDIHDPGQSLTSLLQMACDLLGASRAALYEHVEAEGNFAPHFALGISVGELGKVSSAGDHPVLRQALRTRRAASTAEGQGSLGLPLAPGQVACAPCMASGHTIGLLFVAANQGAVFTDEALATLDVLATRAAEIISLARQTAGQSYLLHKLTLLYQATNAITSTRDRDEVIKQTASHLLRATSADYCEVALFGDSKPTAVRYRPRLGKGLQQTVQAETLETLPDYPAHRQVTEYLRPTTLRLTPATGSAKDLSLLETEGVQAAAIFPLTTGNQALGLARLLYQQAGRQINDQEMELAQAILSIGAVGLQDAVHFEEATSRADQLQVLAEIGRDLTSTLELEVALENAMHNAQRLIQAEACVLFLLDEPGEKLVLKASGGAELRIRDVAFRLEEGIAGWVTRNRQPLVVNDVRTNPLYQSAVDGQTGLLTSSILCVPLETRGEVLGVIEAINHPHGAFTEADQQMLTSVASWAGIALDNANLFQRVAEERRRLEATLVETADAVVLTDRTGRIILVNKAAGQAFRINVDKAMGRPAWEIFAGHPLGDLLVRSDTELPVTMEIITPTERVLYATVSEVTDVGRVAVMQDITALKQIDRMRSQLLGTAAHDLKNPLNAIRLGADLLSDAPLTEQQRKALNMMLRATDNMTSLTTGLLETIRVESTANLGHEPCQVNDLIRRVIEDMRPLAEAKKHKLRYTPPEESLLIIGDPGRLNSVMGNLLSNALKFTPPGGTIDIGVEWDEEQVTITVADNGPGIPSDELPRVFEHLFRGRVTVQDPNNPIEGTGLGLALAKTVIEQHGGRIWVSSEVGQGARFSFSIPREPTPKTGSLRKDSEA